MIRWLAHKLGLGSCPECETLVDYAMEGLPEGQQDKVRQHLSDCPPCREQVRDYWQVREGLGLCAKEQDAPDDLCAKVLARLHEAPSPANAFFAPMPRLGGWPRFWTLLGPAFAALSVAMTLVALAALTHKPALPVAPAQNDLSRMVQAVVDDPHALRVSLAAPGSKGADGLLVLCPGMDHAYLRCEHLASSAWGSDYVLWSRRAQAGPERMASFTVEKSNAPGVYLLQLDAPFAGQGPLDFIVTQQGASPRPGPARLAGSLSL